MKDRPDVLNETTTAAAHPYAVTEVRLVPHPPTLPASPAVGLVDVQVISLDQIRLIPRSILAAEILFRFLSSGVRTSANLRGPMKVGGHRYAGMECLTLETSDSHGEILRPGERDGGRRISAKEYEVACAAIDAHRAAMAPKPRTPAKAPRARRVAR